MGLFYGHEQRIIVQPGFVLFTEQLKCFVIFGRSILQKMNGRFVQDVIFERNNIAIVHSLIRKGGRLL